MRPIQLCCFAVLFAITASAAAQSVWKWTDEKGVVHFSDHPEGPNAVEVNVNAQTYSADESNTRLPTPSSAKRPAAASTSYQSLTITSPAAEETFHGPDGSVSVQASVQPGLKPGDTLQLFLDGQMIGSGISTSVSLADAERGAHTLQARIVGANGITLIASPSVTFHVQMPTVKRR